MLTKQFVKKHAEHGRSVNAAIFTFSQAEMICSFDVSSLSTNVPLEKTIQICIDKLYALPDPPVCLLSSAGVCHFIFDGQYYDQTNGVAMGSPLGHVLANIFLCNLVFIRK